MKPPHLLTFQSSRRPKRLLIGTLVLSFVLSGICPIPLRAQEIALPANASVVPIVETPLALKGLSINPNNPSQLEFIVESPQEMNKGSIHHEADRLIKYFLASLTIPQDDVWVNLSPYEHQRMIPHNFSQTQIGADFLAQDYELKQLASSLIYPESDLGKQFWKKVYEKAYKTYGTTEIPVNTFNKVWIVPDKPGVYVKGQEVFVVHSRLKVLSDQDFLASSQYFAKSKAVPENKEFNHISADIVKEIIIPEIERQVNESERFIRLRQIYQSMILAVWYKQHLRDGLLGKIYLDQSKVKGVDVQDKEIKEKIYDQYVNLFKTGVFNYIKEERDVHTQRVIPRKYFSGGLQGVKEVSEKAQLSQLSAQERAGLPTNRAMRVKATLIGQCDSGNPRASVPHEGARDDKSKFLDELLAQPSDTNDIPILLLAGQPAAGKTTAALEYQEYLKAKGKTSVIINTDNLVKTKGLVFKQIMTNQILRMKFVPLETRMKVFNKLMVAEEVVEDIARQVVAINASPTKTGTIKVDGWPDIEVKADTLIILEGSLAYLMFGSRIPLRKKVFLKVEKNLQKLRIIQRGIQVRGQSPIRATISSEVLTANVRNKVYETGIEDFDAIIETKQDGQEMFSKVDRAMFSKKMIEEKSFGLMYHPQFSVDKFFITMRKGNVNDLAYVSQAVADTLAPDKWDYFRTYRKLQLAIGYDADSGSQARAFEMSRILTANGISVTLIEEPTESYMLAGLSQKPKGSEDKFDVTVHISSTLRAHQIRMFENGITAYLSFRDAVEDVISGDPIRSYKQYSDIKDIPNSLFRMGTAGERLVKKLSIFDVASLKEEIPGFMEAMRAKGVTGIKAKEIEKLLSSYGMGQAQVGALNLNSDSESSHDDMVMDIDGQQLGPMELAAVFLHYLHSIGERGDVVKSSFVTRALNAMAEVLQLRVHTVTQGEQTLLDYPQSLFGVISIGNMHFKYRGERFLSFPAAERLLAIEIMLKKKMTLRQYLESIYKNIQRTQKAEDVFNAQPQISGKAYPLEISFNEFKRVLQANRDKIGDEIAYMMGWGGEGRIKNVDNPDIAFEIEINLLTKKAFILGRYATSEDDTLRLSVETSENLDPKEVMTATKKALYNMAHNGLNMVEPQEEDPFHSLIARLLSEEGGGSIYISLEYTLRPPPRDQGPNDRNKNKAMDSSYGGISFQAQYMNIDVQGDKPVLQKAAPQSFYATDLKGIVPVITSISRYQVDLQ
jgi:uridine kinase